MTRNGTWTPTIQLNIFNCKNTSCDHNGVEIIITHSRSIEPAEVPVTTWYDRMLHDLLHA